MFGFTTISAYHNDLLTGTTSCVQTVQQYLNNIKRQESLNAFVEVYETEALQHAATLDKKRENGKNLKKLHGVVIAIKDVICYKDHTVSAASKMLSGFKSLYTATALQYLIDEDAIIIGNCNCDEFAMGSANEYSAYGPVKNALDERKVPGGSSGGSAVAVQAGMCMLSLGSDTGGSVRQPADHCGLIGFKPGYGSISRYGLIAYASSFDQIGIFGRTVEDVQLVYQVINMPDVRDSTMQQQSNHQPLSTTKRICYFPEVMQHQALDAEIADALNNQLATLKEKGFTTEAVSFPLLEYIIPTYYILTTAEASSNLSRYDGVRYGHRSRNITDDIQEFYSNNRTEGFGVEVKRRIMMGNYVLSSGYYDAYYQKAQAVRGMLVSFFENIFENFDAVLLPVAPATAPLIGIQNEDSNATYLADIYTVMANLVGCAAIAIPLFSHSNNMPFGVQLMAKKNNELTLLELAKSVMV